MKSHFRTEYEYVLCVIIPSYCRMRSCEFSFLLLLFPSFCVTSYFIPVFVAFWHLYYRHCIVICNFCFFSVEYVCIQSLQAALYIPLHFPTHFNPMVQESRGEGINGKEAGGNSEQHRKA